MRRKDRQITDCQKILKIIEDCDVCRLALNDEGGYPYILPLNFGIAREGESLILYFHGAMEGKKYDLMARDNRAGFEMDCGHELRLGADASSCTMLYSCIMGQGLLSPVPEEKKLEALNAILSHYGASGLPIGKQAASHTRLFQLRVQHLTAKSNRT